MFKLEYQQVKVVMIGTMCKVLNSKLEQHINRPPVLSKFLFVFTSTLYTGLFGPLK